MYLLDLQILHKTCVLLENKQHGWPDCLFMQKFATWNYRIRVVTVALRTHIVCGGLSRTPSCHLEQHQALWQSTRRAWAIIRLPKLPIKPHIVCHCACDQIIQALSPFFGQYATKSRGGALEWGYYIYIYNCKLSQDSGREILTSKDFQTIPLLSSSMFWYSWTWKINVYYTIILLSGFLLPAQADIFSLLNARQMGLRPNDSP